MFDFTPDTLIGDVIFGSIGFVAFIYGKRMNLWKPMLCGVALMVYPSFTKDPLVLYSIGLVGTGALYFLRD